MRDDDVVIVGVARTPIGRAPKGSLREIRADDLAAVAILASIGRVSELAPDEIDDIILGCATPELEQGLDLARLAGLRAGLPESVPGLTVNRFCASGLEAIAIAAGKIATGQAKIIVAGGADSLSRVPFLGETLRKNPALPESVYVGMGDATEALAKEFGVTRGQCDAFAARSQERAAAAQAGGRFDDEIAPVTLPDGSVFSRDEGVRPGTTVETLASLRTAFGDDGVITAGNASQRSDGAASVILTTRAEATRRGWKPAATFLAYAVAAVPPERFGIAPALAIPKVLERAGLSLADIDRIEFNEAFAAQSLCSDALYPLPWERTNVNGGAIALGHPLGATGARQTVTLLHEAARQPEVRYGVVAMCAALGMGAAAVFRFPAG